MQTESRVNILLVDDYSENLLALEAILDPLGENLVRAASGEEALKCLLQQDFAVILLDVMMPGLDGFETAALIRKRQQSRYTPIIFLTAFSKELLDYLHRRGKYHNSQSAPFPTVISLDLDLSTGQKV